MPKSPHSVNLEDELWSLVEVEANRRGISASALVSIILADTLRPGEDRMVEVFRNLSQFVTLGLAPWKSKNQTH